MKKKLLLIFSILIICLTLIPETSFAEITEDKYYGRELLKGRANEAALLDAYDKISAAVAAYDGTSREIVLDYNNPDKQITADELEMVYHAYRNDYPEHFWLDITRYEAIVMEQNQDVVVSVTPWYDTAITDLSAAKLEFEQATNEILAKVPATATTDYEKSVIVHDLLAEHITYDHQGAAVTTDLTCHTAYGALVQKSAVCDGYSRAYQHLLYKLDVRSIVIAGTVSSGDHAWNLVELDGKWYHTDVTWGDSDRAGEYPYYSYLNLTSALIAEDHSVDHSFITIPNEHTATDANYYTHNPIEKVDVLNEQTAVELGKRMNNLNKSARIYISSAAVPDINNVSNQFVNWRDTYIEEIAKAAGAYPYRDFDAAVMGRELHLKIVPVDQTLTGEQKVTVKPPTAGSTVSMVSGSGTNFEVSFSGWKDGNGNAVTGNFGGRTEYTAIGTLTAHLGYTFDDNVTVVIEGSDSGNITQAVLSQDKKTITFTYSYTTKDIPLEPASSASFPTNGVKYGQHVSITVKNISDGGSFVNNGTVSLHKGDGAALASGVNIVGGKAVIGYDTGKRGLSIGTNELIVKYQNANGAETEIARGSITLQKAELKAVFGAGATKKYDGTVNFADAPVQLTGFIGSDGAGVTGKASGTLESADIGSHKAAGTPAIIFSNKSITDWYDIIWLQEAYNILTIEPSESSGDQQNNPPTTDEISGGQDKDPTAASGDTYKIIEGNGSEWSGTGTLTIKSDGDYSKFLGIQVDGEYVSVLDYTAKSGSTIITLNEEYLKTLSAGTHTLTAVYNDGTATGTFTVSATATADSQGSTNGTSVSTGNQSNTQTNSNQTTQGDNQSMVDVTSGTGTTGTGSTQNNAANVTTGTGANGAGTTVTGTSPKTQDKTYVLLWTVLAVLSLSCAGAVKLMKKQ